MEAYQYRGKHYGLEYDRIDEGPVFHIISQELERIFNPLFTTKSGGMGMGLSICRSIIEAHDGRLWVAPNNPEGAVFQFMLRADGATSVGASRREQPEEPPA